MQALNRHPFIKQRQTRTGSAVIFESCFRSASYITALDIQIPQYGLLFHEMEDFFRLAAGRGPSTEIMVVGLRRLFDQTGNGTGFCTVQTVAKHLVLPGYNKWRIADSARLLQDPSGESKDHVRCRAGFCE